MSCYNWERGSIVVPKSAWTVLRRRLLTKWNTKQQQLYARAKGFYPTVKAAGKGKKGEERAKAQRKCLRTLCRLRDAWEYEEEHSAIFDAMFETNGLLIYKLRIPAKKYFQFVPLTKTVTIRLPQADVTFYADTHAIEWDVEENNRAVESANGHWFACELWGALGAIAKWPEGTGGKVIGNDEYNGHSLDEGGAGNYVNREYSQVAYDRHRKAAPPWNPYGRRL